MRRVVWTVLAFVVAAAARAEERWDLSAPRVSMRLNAGLVGDLGIALAPAVPFDRDGYAAYEVGAEGRLVALAPGSIFRTIDLGELHLSGGPRLSWKGDATSLRGARLEPGAEPNTFRITGSDGTLLFLADHQHFAVDRSARTLRLFNMDLRLSAELAARLGEPRHEGLAVGVLEISAAAAIPPGAVEQPTGACASPNWGQPDNDVALINLSAVGQVARGGGFVAIAPSAVLKNVGATDVPWISKFSAPQPPYNNDQHPFLVWNMYRVSNGSLQQIGASGLKHAFLTLNNACGCPSGSILWVNCEDVYSTGTNDNSGSLGPRSEVDAHSGIWRRCGSVFDVNCDGAPNSTPGFSGPDDPRRLSVLETDLQTPGAQYYVDGWYVVRDDVNIFNTMAYRSVTPTFGGASWSFGPLGPHTPGPVIDAWVDPKSPGPNADTRRVVTALGTLSLAVRATEVGGGRWRYDYALMNHDIDGWIRSLAVSVPPGAVVTNTTFHDADRDKDDDWTAQVDPAGELVWSSPLPYEVPRPFAPTVNRPGMGWGLLVSFSFEVDSAPTTPQGSLARVGLLNRRVLSVPLLGPTP